MPDRHIWVYPFERNQQEHGGTASASLTVNVYAVDCFHQRSDPTQVTLTNPVPSTASTPTLQSSFETVLGRVTAVSDEDIAKYEWDVQEDSGGGYASVSGSPFEGGLQFSYAGTVGYDYKMRVRAVDVFAQEGSYSSLSDAVTLTGISFGDLTDDVWQLIVSDEDGNSEATLEALYDNVKDSGGVAYSVPSGSKWIEYEWPIQHVISQLMIWLNGAANAYFCLSEDGSTWDDWYGAEADHTGSGTYDDILVSKANEGAADTDYLALASGRNRYILPEQKRVKACRVYLKTSVTVYELKWHVLVAAHELRGEELASLNWSSSDGSYFNLNDGVIKLGGSSSPKFHFDGTDLTLTGTAIFGTSQEVTLDNDGMTIVASDDYYDPRSVKWENATPDDIFRVEAKYSGGTHWGHLVVPSITGEGSTLRMEALAPSGQEARVASYAAAAVAMGLVRESGGEAYGYVDIGGFRVYTGIYVGGGISRTETTAAIEIGTDTALQPGTEPIIIFDINDTDEWTLGVDDSDLDKFKINSGGSLADPSDFELDSAGNIELAGSITLGGTVDGVDIAALKTDVDGFPDELKNLVTAEIQQLENIGSELISATEWGYLAALNQALATSDSPTFSALAITNNITVGGTVDGVDVAALKTDVDGFPDELKNLATGEIQQLENIGSELISSAEWGYLAALNQSLTTSSDVTFDDLRLTSGLVVGSSAVEPAYGLVQIRTLATYDPRVAFVIAGSDKFILGVDDDDNDIFKINSGASLADPSDFELDSAGNMELAGYAVLLGGVYSGRAADPGDGNVCFTGALKSYKNTTEYTGYPLVPLTTPLTSTSWDGDSKTTSDNGTIDLSVVFGAPAGIKGIMARLACYDGTGDEWCALGPSSSEDNALVARVPPGGSASGDEAGFCPCDASGDVYWSCSGDLDNVWIEIWGYII